MIDLKNVSWIRDSQYILKNIDWQVKPGEDWAILGLNGSGKTSLLNMVNGYIWPSKGEVTVLGQRFGSCDIRELRKSIGWVSSSLQEKLHGNESAHDIVLSGAQATIGLFEKPKAEDVEQAYASLAQLDCSHLAQRQYKTLSQGEKQKVLIARGLMASPQLLILDEPCTGIDVFAREQLLATIEQLKQQAPNMTLIYVTHHIEEILPIFGRTLMLKSGEIFASGQTKDLFTSQHFTKFLDTPVKIDWHNERAWMHIPSQQPV